MSKDTLEGSGPVCHKWQQYCQLLLDFLRTHSSKSKENSFKCIQMRHVSLARFLSYCATFEELNTKYSKQLLAILNVYIICFILYHIIRINKIHSIILYRIISFHIIYSYDVISIHIISCFNIILWYFMLRYIHMMLNQFILFYPIIHTRSILLDSSRVTSKSPLWVDGDPRGLSKNMEEPVETWKAPAMMKGAAAQWWPLAVRLAALKMFEVGGKPSWLMIVVCCVS